MHCGTGQGRVFGCLQENIAKSGFGDQCKQQVQDREARMQEDYRLDYGVASQCEADVIQYCSLEKVCFTPFSICSLSNSHYGEQMHCASSASESCI